MLKHTSLYLILCVLIISALGMVPSLVELILIVIQTIVLFTLRYAAKIEDSVR